ncbi:MAG: hypothetical protein FJ358_08175 [Thaumarchaeota archaeon]|nr:hypothetical protein [Nitrososphaerota archaeon]
MDNALINKIEGSLLKLRMYQAQRTLSIEKYWQMTSFTKLRSRFSEKYAYANRYDCSAFMLDFWNKKCLELEKRFLPYPPFSFLRDKTIRATMNISEGYAFWLLQKYLQFLETRLSEDYLSNMLQEDYVGEQIILNSKYMTSYETVQHLYHFLKLADFGCKIDDVSSVVEWGGGYGDMAKLFVRMNSNRNVSYTIIDIPIMSCLQWLYLSSIFGEGKVKIIQDRGERIDNGKINLLPISLVEKCDINADLFISTWALSECTNYAQDYVVNKNWFNARNILLAYQYNTSEVPNAERLGRLAEQSGANVQEMEIVPRHHYAFR